MLTKKHFEFFAGVVAELPDDKRGTFTEMLIRLCQDDNPRFDEHRFRTFVRKLVLQNEAERG